MQNINVNIVPDNFPQTIRYSQGDIGRQFKINVTDFEIPNGATVKIQATKPSGFGFSVAGVVAGSSVTFTTTAEMTDEAGRFQAELQITAGDDIIGTANFLMIGEQNPHPEGTTDGSQGTIIPELTLLVERVEAAASSVLDMEVVATTLPAGSQATYSYDEDLNKATFGIPEGQAGAGAAGVVASAYSAAKTYKVGDYVLYNSNLYRCTTAITTAEAWTAAHWTQVVLADDVTDLKSDLKGLDTLVLDNIDKVGEDVDVTWNDGKLIAYTRNIVDYSVSYYKVTDPISVKGGEVYLLSGDLNYSNFFYQFYDSANNPFGGLYCGTSEYTALNNYVIEVPNNAVTIRLGLYIDGNTHVWAFKKVVGNTIASKASGKLKKSLDDIGGNFKKVYGKNRVDFNAFTPNYYLLSDGSLKRHNGWKVSDYCYVEDLSKITLSYLNSNNTRANASPTFLCTYDKDKNFIEKIGDMPTNPITLGDDVAYVRFCLATGTLESELFMLEGAEAFTGYEPYFCKILPKDEDTFTYIPVDIGTKIDGKLMSANTGVVQDNSSTSYSVTDYIEVIPNSKVKITSAHFYGWALYCFYDKDKNYIGSRKSADGGTVTRIINEEVDVPSNAKYIRLGWLNTNIYNASLFQGIKQSAEPSQRWATKKWTCLGDSLTEFIRTSHNYHDYVADTTGIKVVNMGLSGTGYANGSASNNAFYQRVANVPLDSDVITIFGSFNDGAVDIPLGTATDTGTTTMGGCINTTFDNLFTVLPLANLGVVTPCPWQGANPYDGAQKYKDYVQLIIDICKRRSIPCLDLFHESGLRPWDATFRSLAYTKDNGGGTHPDETGHRILAPKFEAFLDSLLMH